MILFLLLIILINDILIKNNKIMTQLEQKERDYTSEIEQGLFNSFRIERKKLFIGN